MFRVRIEASHILTEVISWSLGFEIDCGDLEFHFPLIQSTVGRVSTLQFPYLTKTVSSIL